MKRKDLKREVTVISNLKDKEVETQEESQSSEPIRPVVSFDDWWLQTQHKYKFKTALKESVKKHFECRGFMNSGKFNDGLRDFGFNV